MRSVWRSVFIWLLMLAVPVQGIAAMGMQHCAPTHERMAAPAAAAQAQHPQTRVHAPAGAVPAATDEAQVLETARAVTADHAVATADFKCSACAACCPALGLAAAAPELPAVPGAQGLASLRLPLVPAFVPGGLDRPPRVFRA